jgi:hypothetical protein
MSETREKSNDNPKGNERGAEIKEVERGQGKSILQNIF